MLDDYTETIDRWLAEYKRRPKKQRHTAVIKYFISVLMHYKEHGVDEVNTAVELALDTSVSSSRSAKHILLYLEDKPEPTAPFLEG